MGSKWIVVEKYFVLITVGSMTDFVAVGEFCHPTPHPPSLHLQPHPYVFTMERLEETGLLFEVFVVV